jgi:membrane-bound serine protease (ClpP class)
MTTFRKFIRLLIATFSIVLISSAQELNDTELEKNIVYTFNIKEQIAKPIWRITQKAFEEAHQIGAKYIIIQMNTYGGLVDMADSIRTKILNSDIPVYIYIDDNAASAGALISIACERIYMRPGSKIGAATVVNQTGEVVPDKFQSYMRATMRATAESHGKDTVITGNDTVYIWKRDPRIAEAMVDPSIYIEGIVDTGKVLTFTAEEAIAFGYCEGLADNLTDLLQIAGIEDYEIVEFTPTTIDKIISFLLNPLIHGFLIMIIIGGLYFELQTPGVGFPLAAAALAAVLYFAPLYLEGIAQNWELIIFILGVVLLMVEIFAIPGFGVAGISGITLMVAGLTLAMVDNIIFNSGDINLILNTIFKAFFIVTVSMFVSLVVSIYLGRQILTSSLFPHIALWETQQRSEGYYTGDFTYTGLTGKTGLAYTVLRPSGKVEIDGEIYDAKSEYGFIDRGAMVKVVRYESGQLYVVPA